MAQADSAAPKASPPSQRPEKIEPQAAVSVAAQESSTHYRIEPFIPHWMLLALAMLILLGVRRAYKRSTRAIRPEYKMVLGFVRLCACGLLLLCLTRPVAVTTRTLSEKGICFVAVDSSGSMNLKDMPGRRTRWDCTSEIIRNEHENLEKLSAELELHRYIFDSSVREIAKLPGEQGSTASASGTSTDITTLLEKLAAESGGSSSAGALLISDGRHNLPTDVVPAAQELGRLGVPLCIIGVGQDATPGDFRDIAIKQLIVPEKAFIGGRTIFRIVLESTLKQEITVPLTIEVDGKKVTERQVHLEAGDNLEAPEIEIPYTSTVLGMHRITAYVGTIPDEANVLNNTATAFFRVFRTKIGVWYVEGAIRPEFGKIRSALETAPNVSLRAINAFMANASSSNELLPTKPEDWAQLRLVILGDISALRFEESALRDLAKFVDEGGSVLMIGGKSNFGAGSWQSSPLAEVFPVEMSAGDGQEPGPLTIAPNTQRIDHPILNVGENFEESAVAWLQLPKLPGVNRFTRLHPTAEVLLKAGSKELLVVKDYGKGRSAVFTADTTWQWVLKANQPGIHRKFWRNLVTWLTRSDYRDASKVVYADAERLQYQVGEEATFRAHVSATEKWKDALKTARISLSLVRVQPNAETQVFSEAAGTGAGEYAKHFTLGTPGTYRFKAVATGDDGTMIDSDSIDLQVTAPDIEVDNPRANIRLLRRIAELSGGRYYDFANAQYAFEHLMARPSGYSKPQTETVELWNSGWVIALFVSLLSFEWLMRKKWGLV